jgi:GTP-binding protein Era
MIHHINTAMSDADIILLVTDVTKNPSDENPYILKLKELDIPLIVVINKIDLSNQNALEEISVSWQEKFPSAPVVPVSALTRFNLDTLLNIIISFLPEGAPWFPKDQLTDKHERFFASEIIREKILNNYQKEIPYSVEVEIESFKEERDLLRISALIHVTRESQKGIIIGRRGEKLKKTGKEARLDIEKFFGRKVFLELYVKVTKEWRNKPRELRRFGYS